MVQAVVYVTIHINHTVWLSPSGHLICKNLEKISLEKWVLTSAFDLGSNIGFDSRLTRV